MWAARRVPKYDYCFCSEVEPIDDDDNRMRWHLEMAFVFRGDLKAVREIFFQPNHSTISMFDHCSTVSFVEISRLFSSFALVIRFLNWTMWTETYSFHPFSRRGRRLAMNSFVWDFSIFLRLKCNYESKSSSFLVNKSGNSQIKKNFSQDERRTTEAMYFRCDHWTLPFSEAN